MLKRVSTYRFLLTYIGFPPAEINYMLKEWKIRLQPLKSLACCGQEAEIPNFRMVYLNTSRKIIDFSADSLSLKKEIWDYCRTPKMPKGWYREDDIGSMSNSGIKLVKDLQGGREYNGIL